jgi:hypothetical protein
MIIISGCSFEYIPALAVQKASFALTIRSKVIFVPSFAFV